ncbi:MAG: hypothetical protein WCG25_02190 [bacterium]
MRIDQDKHSYQFTTKSYCVVSSSRGSKVSNASTHHFMYENGLCANANHQVSSSLSNIGKSSIQTKLKSSLLTKLYLSLTANLTLFMALTVIS